ncbi:ATP-dependent rRNA helicase RRP3 [Wickerhamomyces ciferrii]|uniref:ATP-dependent rRNA helicase RRP3 n=1 Tax=Wickerhamomyces ciferrii (strain ATCC 14091 / BCRC 22168 / CBS 111 / JCM 3599 / NBRC 0793 / NRRL Y-1031 F-60-10) TaxID=1206466 RepID=K0KT93_WICCF|nr:ATP-dependent rRNA helicase RRP3 [Wickerhamomyces ciferrii]CCH45247.1 ATP-dependent rRNA helicase RRP3 [Wickerhamomyces ciferrii]
MSPSIDGKIKKKSLKKSVKKETALDLAEKIKRKALLDKKNNESKESKVKEPESEPESQDEEESKETEESKPTINSFKDLKLIPELLEACQALKFDKPTPIQAEAIPHGIEGRDLIGLAQTGSGKTAAFAIPILQALWYAQTPYFATVLAPTRELAYQIKDTFDALGSGMGLRSVCIVGGMDMMEQARDLMRKPHVIVATPGRLMDHLEHLKGFSLRALKFLVMDEADRLLDMEFGPVLDKIFKVIPRERTTYLFSATMTNKIDKLQRASLTNPVKVSVSDRYSTVDTLIQSMMIVPDGQKNTYLIYLLNQFEGKSIIIFTRTCAHSQRTALLSRILGFSAVPLHGQLTQSQRLSALNRFKSGKTNILVATDVAARGLDIPSVDIVINYDIPTDSKAYIHRVGRTARAGRSGKSVSLVTQYDLELLIRIEAIINMKLPKESVNRDEILSLHDYVDKATAQAIRETKEFQETKGKGGKRGKKDYGDREER